MFGTRTMLFLFALFAIKAFGLALTLFLSVLESQLIVMSIRSSVSPVLPVRIWFRKRRRKPPDKSNQIQPSNIGPHPAHPNINWVLPSFDSYRKRGRRAANNNFLTAAREIQTVRLQNQIAANQFSAAMFQLLNLSLHQARPSICQAVHPSIHPMHIIILMPMLMLMLMPTSMLALMLTMILILVQISRLDDHLLGNYPTRINNFSRAIVFRGRALLAQSLRAVTSMQICHHLRPAAMANAVVPNTIYLLLKESASSFISEGGTQNIGVISVTATYAIYTYSLVQLLPMI